MFSKFIIAAIAAGALLARADPNPSVPGPGDVYNEGSNCQIEWAADSSGTWTQMSIQLMTGDNLNMVHLADLTIVDATKVTTYTYQCPQVTPNSAIYFYQFQDPSSTQTYWTTRFAIADASGSTTPPTESAQPNGDKIPWGTGSIVGSINNSTASSPPASSSNPVSPSSSLSSSGPAGGSGTTSSSPNPSHSNSAVGGSTNGNSSNSNGAAAADSPQVIGALVALAATAFTFVL